MSPRLWTISKTPTSWAMSTYPPGTIGYELDELSRRVANMPWWLWLQKKLLQYRIARARHLMVKVQASLLPLEMRE